VTDPTDNVTDLTHDATNPFGDLSDPINALTDLTEDSTDLEEDLMDLWPRILEQPIPGAARDSSLLCTIRSKPALPRFSPRRTKGGSN
jgi:hypothetical protein